MRDLRHMRDMRDSMRDMHVRSRFLCVIEISSS